MTMPVEYNLRCYKGQDYYQNLRYKHKKTGAVYPLTGYTAKAQIRAYDNAEKLIAEMICSVTGVEGIISLALTAEQTAGIRPGVYRWDLRTIDANGRARYWIKGKFTVLGRVTE